MGWRAHVGVPGVGQFTDALAEMGVPHTIYPFKPLETRAPVEALRGLVAWGGS